MPISEYHCTAARSSTTSDAFNANAEAHRREILDTLIAGEKAVGAIVSDLSMSQPRFQEPARLRPLHEWLAKYEQAWNENERLDRMDDYLKELQQEGEPQ